MFRELEKNQNALVEYIEATYHITNEHLLRRRRELLETNGVISQLPYIESTAKYDPGKEYQDLGLPDPVKELLTGLASVPSGPTVVSTTNRDASIHCRYRGVIVGVTLVNEPGTAAS